MKMKQQWGLGFLIIVTLVYLVIYLFDFSNQDSDIKEIYFADRITAAHALLIDKFNEEYEGKIKVIPIDFPNFDFSTNERKELLARSLRGRGDGIDLFAVDVIWVKRFAKWCERLDKYFTDEEKNRILEPALASCYIDTELVAIPLDFVQGIMFYREDLIDRAANSNEIKAKLKTGITWDEFIQLKQKLNPQSPYYIFPAADFEGLICIFVELVLSQKPDYFEEVGFNLMTPEAERALGLLVDLVHKYKITPGVVTNFTEIPSFEYYIRNDGIFIKGWTTYNKDFKCNPFDLEKEKHLKIMPMPNFKNYPSASTFGGWNLMISKFSDNKKEAMEFIKFLLRDESQEAFFREAEYFPVMKDFYDNPEYTEKYPQLTEYKELIKKGVHRPAHSEYTKYSEIMSHFFESAIKNEISVNEALAKATRMIEMEKMLFNDL